MALVDILNKYDTDKNESHHNYGKYYEKHLAGYRSRAIRYLEIGVWRGGSLRAMREYFHQAKAVVGIDINPATKQFEDPGRGIFVEIGDQRDLSFLERVHAVHGPFDVVLDDGSHRLDDVVASFQRLFPLLRDGGVYIVEDTICFRDDLDYFHKLTRHVNNWRKDAAAGGSDTCVDPFKFTLSVTDPVHSSIREITFTNSAILIFKEVKSHWVVHRR